MAGNSGPLKGETSWEELGLEPERTTVTNKVRRVGDWDPELLEEAIRANGGGGWNSGVSLAVTMGVVIVLMPMLTSTAAEIDRIVDAVAEAIAEVAGAT